MDLVRRVVNQHDVVLLQHRHEDVVRLAFPELAFIDPGFHRLARREIRKAAHEEERLGILDGEESAEDFHPDLAMRRNRLELEDLEDAPCSVT